MPILIGLHACSYPKLIDPSHSHTNKLYLLYYIKKPRWISILCKIESDFLNAYFILIILIFIKRFIWNENRTNHKTVFYFVKYFFKNYIHANSILITYRDNLVFMYTTILEFMSSLPQTAHPIIISLNLVKRKKKTPKGLFDQTGQFNVN